VFEQQWAAHHQEGTVENAVAFLTGAGVGAGLMFLLDPKMGSRRREVAWNEAGRLVHQAEDVGGQWAQEAYNQTGRLAQQAYNQAGQLVQNAGQAAQAVATDVTERAQGLASGNFSSLVGGQSAQRRWQEGGWSPLARTLFVVAGGGLFLYSMTQKAPEACVVGTVGLGLAALGVSDASLEDIAELPREAAHLASNAVSSASNQLNFGQRQTENGGRQMATTQPTRW
jgi:gas vesicle protein